MRSAPHLHFALATLAMSPGRSALASLAPLLAQRVWCGDELGTVPVRAIPTGYAALDAQLPGGGWPRQSVTEILQPQHAVAEWRLLLPGLAPLLDDDHPLVAIGCPHEPYFPGLKQAGVKPGHLVWVRAEAQAQRLWATEQAIKSVGPGAVLAWLPHARAEQIRRLQAHALACEVPVFLLRPSTAQGDASAAPLRVSVQVSAQSPWRLGVTIFKRRGAAHDGVIALRSVPSRLATAIPTRRRTAIVLPETEPQQGGDHALLAGTPHAASVGR